MNKQEIVELVKTQILNAESFGIDDNNPHEAVHLSINEAKELLKIIQSLTQEPSAVIAEEIENFIENIAEQEVENCDRMRANTDFVHYCDVKNAIVSAMNKMQEYAIESMREHSIGFYFYCIENDWKWNSETLDFERFDGVQLLEANSEDLFNHYIDMKNEKNNNN